MMFKKKPKRGENPPHASVEELSPQRQGEILYQALESSSTPLEFYNYIANYLPFLSPESLERYKARVWIKYLERLIDSLEFNGLNINQIRKALISIEGALHLLNQEVDATSLEPPEKEAIERADKTVKVLRIYRDIHNLLHKDLKYIPADESFPTTLFMVKGKKLIGALEKESLELPGLPPPQELWQEIKAAIHSQGLKAALAREKIYLRLMEHEMEALKQEMAPLREKGRGVDIEELAEILEKYFSMVLKYNKSIAEYKKLAENYPEDRELLLLHKRELEKVREALEDLKITEFLAFLISGQGLPQP